MKTNIKLSLILTPAIFLLVFWILVLSNSGLIATTGLLQMILWALLLSFGTAYSVTLFINETWKHRENEKK